VGSQDWSQYLCHIWISCVRSALRGSFAVPSGICSISRILLSSAELLHSGVRNGCCGVGIGARFARVLLATGVRVGTWLACTDETFRLLLKQKEENLTSVANHLNLY